MTFLFQAKRNGQIREEKKSGIKAIFDDNGPISTRLIRMPRAPFFLSTMLAVKWLRSSQVLPKKVGNTFFFEVNGINGFLFRFPSLNRSPFSLRTKTPPARTRTLDLRRRKTAAPESTTRWKTHDAENAAGVRPMLHTVIPNSATCPFIVSCACRSLVFFCMAICFVL